MTLDSARHQGNPVADLKQPRHVLGALHVARHPVEGGSGASEHQSSSTQVSLVPPPWLELTTNDPFFSATRVRPPGVIRTLSPDSTNGLRSTWRGATPDFVKVGTEESAR